MRRALPRKRWIILLVTGLFPAFALSALDAPTALPVDADQTWTIGMTKFQVTGVSDRNLYLASSFPLLLRERIMKVKKHRFSVEEHLFYQKAILNAELKKQVDSLLALQKKRDEELFNETKEFQKKQIRDDYTVKSAVIKDRIKFLRELDPQKIVINDDKAVELKDQGGNLFPAPPFSPLRYADEIGVDVIIWGSIDEIQGYLYLEINVFDRYLEKNIFQIKEAGLPSEIFGSAEKSIPDLITALLGRPWASLLIDVDPAFSYIKINKTLVGMGTVEVPYLDPGDISVEIQAPGYKSFTKVITLKHQDSEVLELKLEKTDEEFLLIETIPPGANVYFNSLWMGKTPLVLEKPQPVTRLTLSLAGFHNSYDRIKPSTPETLSLPLVKSIINLDQFKDAKRSRYYTSLAAFLISLPLPIFSISLLTDYAGKGDFVRSEFFAAAYYWTFFISGALFVNMVIDLIRYVDSYNKPIG